jgi:16S rRNA (guanine1207-N2)-methyltransferase
MPDGQYFDRHPNSPSSPRTVPLVLPDLTLDLQTDRGVFSGDAVDRGTKLLLLEGPPPPASGNLLDLGCGYGAIAVALARRSPAATVWAIDVNQRALALTAANAANAGAANVSVTDPEGVPAHVRLDAIYSNPPIRIGKDGLHELLDHWLDRLTEEGRAYLVVHKHLGSDSLARRLTSQGWTVERMVSRMGYRLLAVGRATGEGPPS